MCCGLQSVVVLDVLLQVALKNH